MLGVKGAGSTKLEEVIERENRQNGNVPRPCPRLGAIPAIEHDKTGFGGTDPCN